jgi:hypothetical protein
LIREARLIDRQARSRSNFPNSVHSSLFSQPSFHCLCFILSLIWFLGVRSIAAKFLFSSAQGGRQAAHTWLACQVAATWKTISNW